MYEIEINFGNKNSLQGSIKDDRNGDKAGFGFK